MKRVPVIVALVALLVAAFGRGARADGSWLDAPIQNWNTPGASLPAAPAMDPSTNPMCLGPQSQARPPETAEDYALTDAGWTLVAAYQGGFGVKLIEALSGYDGMCRPLGYQVFVFVDGSFAGTLSPVLMDSRMDGALSRDALFSRQNLSATFLRYTPTDPLCCPSSMSSLSYTIDTSGAAPVVVPAMTAGQG